MTFTGKTKNLGLIGYPVEHSLSPVIQNPAIAASGQDFAYIAMPVKEVELETAVKGLQALGFCGFNVTIPHKVNIIKFLDAIDENAKMIGAVNTVVVEDGKLTGHNTDSVGFVTGLEKKGFVVKGKKAVLLGAGGAARAVVWGLIKSGIESIILGVRNPQKAKPLAEAFSSYAKIKVQDWEAQEFQDSLSEADLLVNTTPLGMYPKTEAMPPIHWEYIKKETFVYDIIYVPQQTKFLQEAQKRGNPILNGEAMLVEQGAAAFKLWTGKSPDSDLMTKALRESLSNSQ